MCNWPNNLQTIILWCLGEGRTKLFSFNQNFFIIIISEKPSIELNQITFSRLTRLKNQEASLISFCDFFFLVCSLLFIYLFLRMSEKARNKISVPETVEVIEMRKNLNAFMEHLHFCPWANMAWFKKSSMEVKIQ